MRTHDTDSRYIARDMEKDEKARIVNEIKVVIPDRESAVAGAEV
jgi:hypothetical protein